MKLKYILFSALISSVFFSSCQDLEEDPRSRLTPESFFNTPQELEGAIAAMYRKLAPDDAYGFTGGMTSYFGSDDLATHAGSNKGDFRDFDRLQGGAGNASMTNQWNAQWKSIYQANAILSVIDNVKFTSDAEKNGAVGQAYFIRALCYYYMVRTFGDLPIVTEGIDVNDRPARQPVKDIYTIIVQDLQTAETTLPESWPGQPGKATRYAAKALLADVYQTMAGWPINDASNYALAAAKAKEVIDANKYRLVSNYGDVFKTNNNAESVFSLQFNIGGGLPRRMVGQAATPDEEESLAGDTGWGDFHSEIAFYRNAPKCERTNETFYTTLKKINKSTEPATFDLVPWDDMSTLLQHPFYKKFRTGVAPEGTTEGDGINETENTIIKMNASTNKTYDMIRYAGVLLNYAESSAMAGAPTAESYAAINQVRKRAGLPDLTPGLSQIAFRDSVVYERAYEFAGELGVRWFDIVRLQLLPQVIAARVKGIYQVDQYWENELNPSYTSGEALQTRYLAPIPQDEMDRNKEVWTQNPGY